MSAAPPAPNRLKRALYAVMTVAVLLGLIALGGGYAVVRYQALTPVEPNDTSNQEVTVPQGVTLREMGRRLQKAGLIRSAFSWRVWLLLNPPPPIKAGRHLVQRGMNVVTMAAALGEKPLSEDAPLTMVEGWRLRDADGFLTQGGLIEAGAYQRAANEPARFKIAFPFKAANLEGYLYPETYRVPLGRLDVDKLIQRQLDAFHERFYLPYQKDIEASGRTLHQLVIVASLLEREESNPSVRPDIAGIIYRRLDAASPLGIDATSRYTLEQWNDRKAFLAQLRNPEDPYNTRTKPGLPPSPIGAPSITSLVAALRPVASPYWYYLHDSKGVVHYGRNPEEHEANRRKYNVY